MATLVCGLGLATALVPWAVRNRLVNDLGSTTTFGRTLIARTAYYDRGFTFYAPGWGDLGDERTVAARRIVQEGANRRQSDGTIAGRLRQELDLGPIEANNLMRIVAMEAIERRPDFAWMIFDGQEERARNHLDEVKDVTWDPRTAPLLPGKPAPGQDRDAQQILNIYQPARYSELLCIVALLGLLGGIIRGQWRHSLVITAAATLHIVFSAALDGPQERYRYTVDPLISVVIGGGAVTAAWLMTSLVRLMRRQVSPENTSAPRATV
jgi:hypothetical protein